MKTQAPQTVPAGILTIGDEILIGQIDNTNATWLARQLTDLGFDVKRMLTVGDTPSDIEEGLSYMENTVDFTVVTGGLGPTRDDLTRETIARYFGRKLIYKSEVEEHIRRLFARMNYPFTENNKSQAMVPEGTKILWNFYGTAPGMWIEHRGKIFVFLPGVPFEMKHIFTEELKPLLNERFHLPVLVRKTVSVFGIGESLLADRLKNWEAQLPPELHLAYLPSPKRIRLRLSARTFKPEKIRKLINEQIEKLKAAIPDLTVSAEHEDLTPEVHRLMKTRGKTLSVAESCTGGHVMAALVDLPGASHFLKGGIVAYATEIKEKVLNIPAEIIEKHSVVSEEVAREMALKVQSLLQTDYAIAVTGNAGPGKGDSQAEVGTCIIAVAGPEKKVTVQRFLFGQPREKAINRSVSKAFEMLIRELKS